MSIDLDINQKSKYVEIGTDVQEENGSYIFVNPIFLPAPSSVVFSEKPLISSDETVAGTTIAQEIAKPKAQLEMTWSTISCSEYWRINSWFLQYGNIFVMKFFSHTDGKVKIRKFIKDSDSNATPSEKQKTINGFSVPAYYREFAITAKDVGGNSIAEQGVQ